jgi:ABC-type Mn2+/Zn2+ transport system permease subunit
MNLDWVGEKAFWAALLMGLAFPFIGRHLVLGRAIMLGLALPQVSIAGVAFAFFAVSMGWTFFVNIPDDASRAVAGALLFTIPALLIPSLWRNRVGELSEGWLAVVYLAAISTAHLLLSNHAIGEIYVEDLFHGRLVLISDRMLLSLALVMTASVAAAIGFRRRLLLGLIDADFARAGGVGLRSWRIVLALINGSAIGVAVAAVGPLVTFGFLMLPVLAALPLANSLRQHLYGAIAAGAVMAIAGCALSFQFDLPMGDSVVAAGCGLLVAVRLVSALFGRFA